MKKCLRYLLEKQAACIKILHYTKYWRNQRSYQNIKLTEALDLFENALNYFGVFTIFLSSTAMLSFVCYALVIFTWAMCQKKIYPEFFMKEKLSLIFGGQGVVEHCPVPANSNFSETLLVSCSRDSHKHHCYFSVYSNTQRSALQSQHLPVGKDGMFHITES